MKYLRMLKQVPKLVLICGGCLLLGIALLIVALLVNHGQPVASNSPSAKAAPAAPIALVEITPTGFVPSTLNVSKGTKVIWINQDTMPHRIAADPYPTHADLPALYAPKALGNKETYSFTFTKPATVNYHDDLNPTAAWEGTVTVK